MDEGAYRRQIVRLTEERNAARAERDDIKEKLCEEIRILYARLAQATSPQTEALTIEVRRLRARNDQLERQARQRK